VKSERFSIGADLALLAVAAVWGLTFAAVQRALGAAGPFSFLAARFALAAVVLGAAFPRRVLRLDRGVVRFGALLGIWLTVGYALQTVGLLYTTASRSGFITGLSVVLVPVLSLAVSRVRPRITSAAAVVLAASGLYLLTAPRAGGMNPGDLLTLGCAVAFALHIVTTERAAPRHDPVPLAFCQIVTTAAVCTALMAVWEGPRLPLTAWTISALAITGVVATAVAFSVQMWAQRRTSATHVAVIFTAEPVFAALFAWIIQHEVLGVGGLAGGALIVVGILVAQLGAAPRAVPEDGAGEAGGASAKETGRTREAQGEAVFETKREERTMSEERQVSSGGGHGVILILVGGILAVGMALFGANLGAFIDSLSFAVNVRAIVGVLVVVGLIAAFLWCQGHRLYALSKGYSGLTGVVLGLFAAVGLLILLALPARKKAAEAEPAVGEASGEEEAPADEGQGD